MTYIRILALVLWLVCTYAIASAYYIHNRTVIEIPLQDYYFKARIGNPTSSVREQTRKFGASVGINGTFFCPQEPAYHYCGADNSSSSDRIIEGIVYSKYPNDTGERGIIGVTKDNIPLFVQNNKRKGYMRNTNQHRLHEIYYGLGNFPILLDSGIDVTTEFIHLIDDKMFQKATRSFICIPKSNDRIFMGFVPNKSMYEMGKYLKETYDCHFAINLDAGKSSALVVDDRYIVGPGRKVADGFVAIPKPQYIEQKIKTHILTPGQQSSINTIKQLIQTYIQKRGTGYKKEFIHKVQTLEASSLLYPLADKRAFLRRLIEAIEQIQ